MPPKRLPIPSSVRRACLAAGLLPWLPAASVRAEVVNMSAAELRAFNLRPEGVTLDFPRLADTGASVPLRAELQAPAGKLLAMIEVFLPENPNTLALRLRLPDPPARYTFSTRLRLAGSQDVWVVATCTDGQKFGASAPTIVTSSACFDGS